MASSKMSDSDLRKELKRHGIDVGPITDSTIRNLYLKKLEKLNRGDNDKSPGRTAKSSHKTVSTEVNPSFDDTPRRRSTRRSLPQASSKSRRSAPPPTDDCDDFIEDSDESPNFSRPFKTPSKQPSANGREEMPPPTSTNPRRRSTAHVPDVPSTKGRKSITSTVNGNSNTPNTHIRTVPKPPPPSTTPSNGSSQKKTWSQWMPGKKWLSNGGHSVANGEDDHLEVSDADFSDAEHISPRRTSTINSSYMRRDVEVSTSPRLLFTPSPPSTPVFQASENLSSEYPPSEAPHESWTRHIPNLLLVTLLLLIIGVFAVYTVRKEGHLTDLKETELKKLICPANVNDKDVINVCYPEEDLKKATNYTGSLFDILSEHASQFYCLKENVNSTLVSVDAAKKSLKAFLHPSGLEERYWKMIVQIIVHMGYNYYDLAAYDKNDVLIPSTSSVPLHTEFLECRRPRIPISCRLMYQVHRIIVMVNAGLHWLVDCLAVVVSLIACVGILLILALIFHKIRNYRRHLTSRRKEEITDVVITVSRFLQDQMREHEKDQNLPQYIPADNLRNMVSQTNEKVCREDFWASVRHHIYDFESSIAIHDRRGTGEVWYWKGGTGWQGSALPDRAVKLPFETPPTECLKIRNMFLNSVVDNDLRQRLTRELLKKCSSIGDILHIGVEVQGSEGLVYILCNSRDTAGKAYRKIHANYFDGKLVTVKFLRLDKYYKRFPEASNCRYPIHVDLTYDENPE